MSKAPRTMMQSGGMLAGCLILLLLGEHALAQTDTDILIFALNLECLEGEFYNYAAGNGGLSAADRGGGPAPIGGHAASLSSEILGIAKEIAQNEKTHVQFLRSVLGSSAVPCPQINLTAFADVFNAAVAPATFNPPFSPYQSDLDFLLATFLFEDIGTSAYQGAAPLISNKTVLAAAAGNYGTEAYQSGLVRYILFNEENTTYLTVPISNGRTESLSDVTAGVASLRARLGAGSNQNVRTADGSPLIVPVDKNGQTIPRTVPQIIAIATGGASNNKGGFFPNGFNGKLS